MNGITILVSANRVQNSELKRASCSEKAKVTGCRWIRDDFGRGKDRNGTKDPFE